MESAANLASSKLLILKEVEMANCEHVKLADPNVKPIGEVCDECVKSGQRWVQLRECLVCGHIGCCDSSPGRHATKHFHDSGHPVMQAFKSGSNWKWCYEHQDYV
jgi:uncharacterized UBP type Zn finger protein